MVDTSLAPRSIALIGLSGTGKSTVAATLAAHLGWEWSDTDSLIVDAAGKPVSAIFAEWGEPLFRDMEEAALGVALTLPAPRIIATGGGLVLRPSNRKLLRLHCRMVWLDAPDAEIIARLSHNQTEARPLLAHGAAERIAAQRSSREAIYRRLAHHTSMTSGRTPDAIAAEIIAHLCYTASDHVQTEVAGEDAAD